MNLKEYPRAAQLKKVTVLLLTAASLSQMDRVKKVNENGIPAEKPRKNIATTRGCNQTAKASFQVRFFLSGLLILVFSSHCDYPIRFKTEVIMHTL